jgi:hypothetical protein
MTKREKSFSDRCFEPIQSGPNASPTQPLEALQAPVGRHRYCYRGGGRSAACPDSGLHSRGGPLGVSRACDRSRYSQSYLARIEAWAELNLIRYLVPVFAGTKAGALQPAQMGSWQNQRAAA